MFFLSSYSAWTKFLQPSSLTSLNAKLLKNNIGLESPITSNMILIDNCILGL